jgi:hypothetical protein
VKLLWAFTFVTGGIVFAIDAAGYPEGLAMSLFLLLMSAAYGKRSVKGVAPRLETMGWLGLGVGGRSDRFPVVRK